MRFNSFLFWAFLPVVTLVSWALPQRPRRWWLLGASYVFYGTWHLPYLALLFACAALNHSGAKWIISASHRTPRGVFVLAANLALLILFKYADWMTGNLNLLSQRWGVDRSIPPLDWVVPLGISFYVLHAMSYTIDIMRKREVIHSFWDFQLYMAFFPQLIAGPLMRAREFFPQVEGQHPIKLSDVREGLGYVVTGLFLKIVLADGLASPVDRAFAHDFRSLGCLDVYLMSMAFGLQVYLDFSSYSRIAIGSAKLCGIQLVQNFNFPYSSRSPVEFWQRWHISLSRWIRDYLFFPLVGRDSSLFSLCRAAVVSMALCGLWHGANWNFLLWGVYHGFLIAGYHVAKRVTGRDHREPARRSAPSPLRWPRAANLVDLASLLLTFGLVSLGWIFFRSQSVGQSLGLWAHALNPVRYQARALSGTFYIHVVLLVLGVWASSLIVPAWERYTARSSEGDGWGNVYAYPALQGVAAGCLIILCLIYLQGQKSFIYFQF